MRALMVARWRKPPNRGFQQAIRRSLVGGPTSRAILALSLHAAEARHPADSA
jgi:hypothetical protein